jgi:hypothetical protein
MHARACTSNSTTLALSTESTCIEGERGWKKEEPTDGAEAGAPGGKLDLAGGTKMAQGEKKRDPKDGSRRKFLQTVGATVPTLTLLSKGTASAADEGPGESDQSTTPKFTPIDLSRYFSCSPTDYGPQEHAMKMSGDTGKDGLIRMPAGQQNLQGIPFLLGPEGVESKRWLALSDRPKPWLVRNIDIPVRKKASYLCVVAFCDWDENESAPSSDPDLYVEKVGQRLAEAVLVFDDGTEKALPIRRRFEVVSSNPSPHLPYAAVPYLKDVPVSFADPLSSSADWGSFQQGVITKQYPKGADKLTLPLMWVSALANPDPDRMIATLRLKSTAEDTLLVCGLTLFHGEHSPLQLQRLYLYRLTLPEAAAEDSERWKVDVDLGVVARTFVLEDFSPEEWLSSPQKGLGKRTPPAKGVQHLYVEMTTSRDATLTLRDGKTGKQYRFDVGQVAAGREVEGEPAGARIEILGQEKVWVHAQVLDAATRRPTPVRIAFRSKEGRYIPPYGHRTEVNDLWFEDYGADVKLMDSPFAYVDGTFQIELPVGDVFLEMTKGFEYGAVRQKITIEPHQRNLSVEIPRFAALRSQGWATADVHVHFLSPTTAVLEGQAEGVNLINLLAAQWGDMYTNVGDFFQGPLTSHDKETIVWVGTENRQHILGHLCLLGGHGMPVYPMSASGPGEAYIGDPLWTSMAEWADACREREGLAVCAHFPSPTGEVAADIILGKVDALELYPSFTKHFNSQRFLDWYRYLNCGYRLPAVAGTDKMGAYMPVGANRTYAYLGQEEFNFVNWAKAVRAGNTFVSSGPLLLLKADGRVPGEEITMNPGGGTVEVHCQAKCFVPMHGIEIVLNGHVVASHEVREGASEITLNEKIHVPGPGWIAARGISHHGPVTNWNFHVAAHTSPVYVRVPGQDLFSAASAAYMLTLIDGAQTWVEGLATRPDPGQFEKIRKVFLDAREIMHRRLHQHGIQH